MLRGREELSLERQPPLECSFLGAVAEAAAPSGWLLHRRDAEDAEISQRSGITISAQPLRPLCLRGEFFAVHATRSAMDGNSQTKPSLRDGERSGDGVALLRERMRAGQLTQLASGYVLVEVEV